MAKAKQYSGKLWIWESSVAFRNEVERVLARIKSTQAGQTLLKHIDSKAHWILISPFRPTKEDPVNAYAQGASAADAAPAGYVAETVTINVPFLGAIEFPTVIGTGKGSRVDIFYHPATWNQLSKNMGHILPGAGAGELLFHELIHGYREQSGLLRYRDKVSGEERMTSVEEFYAIAASNVYRSERGFTQLRADHQGFERIKAEHLKAQSGYYEQYKSYIDQWFSEQRTFCLDLAKVSSKFNPFREAAVQLKLMSGPSVSMRL